MTSVAPVTESSSPAKYSGALAILTTLFFMWGLLTSLNDVLVPHLKSIFDLNYAEVMLVQFAFFSAYFLFSIPSGKLIDWLGYKKSMVVSLLVMAVGGLGFIAAAGVPSFALFLAALLILGAGITALQVAANPYVTVLGPSATASSRLTLTQAFNSLGTTIGPPIGGLLILAAAPKTAEEMHQLSAPMLQAYRVSQASSVKLPYLVLAGVLVLLAIAIGISRLPAMSEAKKGGEANGGKMRSVWTYRHLVLGAIAIFVYVGAEVSIGSFLINYMSQSNIGNMTAREASKFVPLYWGGAMVGRFIGSGLLQKVRPGKLLGIVAVGACALVLTSMMTTGHTAMYSILFVGLFNAIMFPTIFALGVAELGPLTGDGSGVLATAIVGGAILPLLQGALADRKGIQFALIIPALCYLYILFYGLKGSQPREADRAVVAGAN
jgi:MFS transporter, FHS family, L-fucose permease